MRRTASPEMDIGSATIRRVPQQTTVGADFARAFGEKDSARIRELLHPEIDFRGLTPNRFWEASNPDDVVEILFGDWLEDTDHVDGIEGIEADTVADRERVGYRFSVSNRRRALPRRAAGLPLDTRRPDRLDPGRLLRFPPGRVGLASRPSRAPSP